MSKQSSNHIIEIKTLIDEAKDETSSVDDENQYASREIELNKRAKHITETLQQLTNQQVERYRFRHIMQVIIVAFFMAIVTALTIAIIICINYIIKNQDINFTSEITILVGSCVTYLTSVISIVTIIVKYIFPENEDKLLAEIVPKILEEEKMLFQDETKDIDKKNEADNKEGK